MPNRPPARCHVAIVGGGITGLAYALRAVDLLAAPALPETIVQPDPPAEAPTTPSSKTGRSHPELPDVVVLEAGLRAGGKLLTMATAEGPVEGGPLGVLSNRQPTLDLLHRIGLGAGDLHIRPLRSLPRYLFLGDRLRPFPGGLFDLLRTDLLSLRGRLRLLAEPLMLWARPWGRTESVHDFFSRRIGTEAADVLAAAFVTGIFAGDSRELSMQACFPDLLQRERAWKSLTLAAIAANRGAQRVGDDWTGTRGRCLIAPKAGMQSLADRMVAALGGDRVQTSWPVAAVERADDAPGFRYRIWSQDDRSLLARTVVLTAGPAAAAGAVDDLDRTLAAELRGLRSAPVAVVAVTLGAADAAKAPAAFGYLAPARLGRPVLGMVFTSAVFPQAFAAGTVQLRAILGGANRPDVVEWSDEQLVDAVRDDLRQALKIAAPFRAATVCRWRDGIPQYDLDHPERLERLSVRAARHPGLHLAGFGLHGVGVNDCIEAAARWRLGDDD